MLSCETVEGHIEDVEGYVGWLFENSKIDAIAYTEAVTALSQASLALARYGRGTAERSMREASDAEARLWARHQTSATVRHAVRAAIAAMLCLVDADDERAAQDYLQQLMTILPRRRPNPAARAATTVPSRTYTATPALSGKAVWHSRPGVRAAAGRQAPHRAHGLVPG